MYVAYNGWGEQLVAMKENFLPAVQRVLPSPGTIVTLKGNAAEHAARRVAGKLQGWEGPVEMIICSLAGAFVGTWASTYSGYVHRLRGYMPFTADKRILFQQASRNNQEFRHPSWAAAKDLHQVAWQREWVEAFQL